MKILNFIADQFDVPQTGWALVRRLCLLLVAGIALAAGDICGHGATVGWLVGYLYGSLTVYCMMREYIK